MKKTFIIAAALLLAGAALTAMSVRADKTDSLTENNIEALSDGEYSNHICYNSIKNDPSMLVLYCGECKFIHGAAKWYSSTGTCQ